MQEKMPETNSGVFKKNETSIHHYQENLKQSTDFSISKGVIDVEDRRNNVEYKKEFLTEEEKERYAEENIKLVYFGINRLNIQGVDFDELESIAMLAYAKALHTFDKSRNIKFSTYAIRCIQNDIFYFLRKEKKHIQKDVSMEHVLGTDKNGRDLCVEDTISEKSKLNHKPSIEQGYILKEEGELFLELIKKLSKQEQYIILHRYGLDGKDVLTQREIAENIGMSQANISKIEKTILNKLKIILYSRGYKNSSMVRSEKEE